MTQVPTNLTHVYVCTRCTLSCMCKKTWFMYIETRIHVYTTYIETSLIVNRDMTHVYRNTILACTRRTRCRTYIQKWPMFIAIWPEHTCGVLTVFIHMCVSLWEEARGREHACEHQYRHMCLFTLTQRSTNQGFLKSQIMSLYIYAPNLKKSCLTPHQGS